MSSQSSEHTTLSSLLREAKQVEPLIGAEQTRQLISAQRIVHEADALRAPWRKPLMTVLTVVVSAALGAIAALLLDGTHRDYLPFVPVAPGGTPGDLPAGLQEPDSTGYTIGPMVYRYFSYDTLFEQRLRNLPAGMPGNADMALRCVELTPVELARIGVRVEAGEVELYTVFHAEPQLAARFVIGPEHIHYPDMQPIDEHPSVVVPGFEPLLISDNRGMWRRIAIKRETADPALLADLRRTPAAEEARHVYLVQELIRRGEEKLRRRINTLIPVLVRTGRSYTEADRRARRYSPDVILWYEPTDEFLAHLPDRVASRLRVELAASELLAASGSLRTAQQSAQQSAQQPAPVRRLPDLRGGDYDAPVREERPEEVVTEYVDRVVGGETYLDVWRTSAGVIQGTYLYPNPAPEGRTALRYKLAEVRTITITVYDIWGRRIRELVTGEQRQAGEGEFTLVCGDLPEGMYMVVLSTERGEQVVQRLMIE